MVDYSILDLVRVPEGATPGAAIDNGRLLAAAAEALGYERYWVAEHHNMAGIASAAVAVVLAHVAAGTRTIRIGAGGVMLPNHAPYFVAETFGTLAQLHPGRIDLGVGRADGSADGGAMASVLRHHPHEAAQHFSEDVRELMGYFGPDRLDGHLRAAPAPGTDVPVFILGTSLFGADLAGRMGLPYAYGSHLFDGQLVAALARYRSAFGRSHPGGRPHAIVGLNVYAADTDAEAQRLATTRLLSLRDLNRGYLHPSRPPVDDIAKEMSDHESAMVDRMLARHLVGSPATLLRSLRHLIDETGADELMFVSDIHDLQARLKSCALVAGVMTELADAA